MKEELKIIYHTAYLDGGTQVFHFDDGKRVWVDHRLFSPTDSKYFESYPNEQLLNIELEEKYVTLIENFDIKSYYERSQK